MVELQEHINEEVKEKLALHDEHLRIANEEMGVIKQDIALLKADVAWVKDILKNVDNRMWWVLGTIVAMGLMQIVLRIVWK